MSTQTIERPATAELEPVVGSVDISGSADVASVPAPELPMQVLSPVKGPVRFVLDSFLLRPPHVQLVESSVPQAPEPDRVKGVVRFVFAKLRGEAPAVPRTGNHFLGHEVREWTYAADLTKKQTSSSAR